MSTDAANLLEDLDRRQNELIDALEHLNQRIVQTLQAWSVNEADEDRPVESAMSA